MSVNTYALTTRQRLQDFMGLSAPTVTQASVLDRCIDAVTDFIEHYCQRRFKLTVYTQEVYNGTDTPYILLKNFPVDSTTAITLERRSSSANEDDWDSIDSEDYFVHYDEGIVEFIGGYLFRKYPRAFRITYKAGYDFNTTDKTLESVALGDLEYATWKLASTAYNQRKGSGNVDSERLGDYAVTFRKLTMEDDDIKAILDKYIRLDEI
jgi:hypothetical protein